MSSPEIRRKFLEFFESKGHIIISSASLVPENDPTTLFTGSGMQPMIKYLLGEKHPLGKRIADSQKCFRSQDIEEVGDNRHTTFFEMLGNWSFGDYFKQEQLRWIFEFLTQRIGLSPENIYVTVFRGNDALKLARDEESVKIWQELFRSTGIEARAVDFPERDGLQGGRIFYYDENKNWWSRASSPDGMPLGEPSGPDSEMFWDFGANLKIHEHSRFRNRPCHVNCDCGRFLEIGNNVFMEYVKTGNGFANLSQKNVDFGGGLERIAAAQSGDPDIFNIDVFREMQRAIRKESLTSKDDLRRLKIILDHIRASVFLVADGVMPSNKDRGYMLRRLMRRSIVHAELLELPDTWLKALIGSVIVFYQDVYPELSGKKTTIESVMSEEHRKFSRTLLEGLEKFRKLSAVSAKDAFNLHQTYGFPFELTKELMEERGESADEKGFEASFRKHQEISRADYEKKFGGHGLILGASESKEFTPEEKRKVVRLHTATHLLQQALRDVLGMEVRQMGSDITPERTRFDFSFARKLTPEEVGKVETVVNQKIKESLPVQFIELPIEEARKTGSLSFFQERYPEKVRVYFIGRDLSSAWSKEFCGGPHVENTSEIGQFKIAKEESISSEVRRIRGIVNP